MKAMLARVYAWMQEMDVRLLDRLDGWFIESQPVVTGKVGRHRPEVIRAKGGVPVHYRRVQAA